MDYAPLAALETLDGYRRLFADAAFWAPYAREVCARHGLAPREPVRIGVPGTCPAPIVGEQYVVKFFGRLFEGGQSFAVEQEAARLIGDASAIPVPRIFASGDLVPVGDGSAAWPWPYLVYEYIPARSLGQQLEQVTLPERLRIAVELGAAVRRLHEIPLRGSPVFPDDHGRYRAFLERQRAACLASQREWGSLPERLLAQIEEYLPPLEELVDTSRPPHLIHADLTRDHLLGRVEGGRWQTLALIDFGDAMTGDLLYELVALHLDLFGADARLLRAFLDAYGLPEAARRDLPRRALATALLHQFDVFAGLPAERLNAPSLEALAGDLWGAGS